jgi:glutathione S-transferase
VGTRRDRAALSSAPLDHTGELNTEEYRRLSPFQQIPVIDDDGFVVAESAAVVLYIAQKAGKLIPADFEGRRA